MFPLLGAKMKRQAPDRSGSVPRPQVALLRVRPYGRYRAARRFRHVPAAGSGLLIAVLSIRSRCADAAQILRGIAPRASKRLPPTFLGAAPPCRRALAKPLSLATSALAGRAGVQAGA